MRPSVLLIFSAVLAVITALAWNYGWGRAPQAEASGVTAVSAAFGHTCALTDVDGVKCWGWNGDGRLGDGTTTPRSTPADVCSDSACSAPLSGVATVSAGSFHTCAVTTAGGVKCWGFNSHGQLGDGTTATRLAPVDVLVEPGGQPLSDVASVSSGFLHTCAVTTSGGVKCWGDNFFGQVGDSTSGSANDRTTPVDVCADASCATPLTGITAVSANGTHTCAVTTTGGVKCWGRNDAGQLGNGTDANSTTPVDVCADATCAGPLTGVATISPRGGTCVLTTAGGVKCWGWNGYGQLGDGTNTSPRTVPVDVCGDASCAAPLAGVAAVSGGSSSCAVTTAGGVKCWGENGSGQLSIGTSTGPEVCPDNVQCSTTPVDACADVSCATLLSGIAAVSAGGGHVCALTTVGGVKCWGSNSGGQLGAGTSDLDPHPVPVDVTGLEGKPPKQPHPGDTDGDGCSDQRENGLNPAFGGQRDYLNFWDFFDVWTGSPLIRDRVVTAADIGGVVARFGAMRSPAPTKAEALTEALTPPAPPPAYHAAFDRGPPLPGQNVWNLQPPDGAITVEDIAAVVAQFGHTCVEA